MRMLILGALEWSPMTGELLPEEPQGRTAPAAAGAAGAGAAAAAALAA